MIGTVRPAATQEWDADDVPRAAQINRPIDVATCKFGRHRTGRRLPANGPARHLSRQPPLVDVLVPLAGINNEIIIETEYESLPLNLG